MQAVTVVSYQAVFIFTSSATQATDTKISIHHQTDNEHMPHHDGQFQQTAKFI